MAVLQHYYTSYVNRETGSAGFQVKAMSPGIGGDAQSTIARLISYRIPPRLDEYAIASHPMALRYFYRTPQEAILLCSQSNGTDENGRPGNFFAHSLVTPPDIFTSIPPILYWRSPFWRSKDPGTRTAIEPINSVEEIETTFDIDGVWNFLAQRNRVEHFYKLMSALVHCNSTQRRIVIIDNADNVAQWIAALTIMLPPDYRPLLTFATYHHDPYQSQFMVTGTTPDSSFRASPDEYRSYFILTAETGQISDVEDSPYAREAMQAARSSEVYESRLLSLIADYTPRFPHPERIDEQLDSLALYAGMVSPHQIHPFTLSPQEVQAAHLALTALEEDKRYFSKEDVQELKRLHYLLHGTHRSQDSEEVDREYHRSVALFMKHQISTDESALTEMQYVTQRLIVDSDLTIALQLLKSMKQTYSDNIFYKVINSADYMQWLGQSVKDIDALKLGKVWTYLGVYFNPSQYSSQFIISGLKRLGDLWNNGQAPQSAKELFAGIEQAIKGREEEWLQLIVANYAALPEKILQRFYCILVRKLSPQDREPYRAIVRQVEPDIEKAEMHYDIAKVGPQKALIELEEWITYARRRRLPSSNTLLESGISNLMMDIERRQPEQKSQLAAKILMNQTLAPLPPESENLLVAIALSNVSLSSFDDLALEMCKKYRTRQGISKDTRTVMDGLLAMQSGELDGELAGRLHERFERLRQRREVIGAEIHSFVMAFLKVCTSNSSHQQMLNTFFNWNDDFEGFWQAYWHTFKELLGDPATAIQAMRLLAFWFVARPEKYTSLYLVQDFFILLPEQLEAASKARGFHESTRVINAKAQKEQWRWYPLVEDYFTGRKNALQWVGQSIAAPFKKRPQDTEEGRRQAEREQKERAELGESIARLFSKKPREQHRRLLSEIYDWQKFELFWSIYQEYFKAWCGSADKAQQVLDLLAFWFDDAFTTLQAKIYIPQQFFLALRETLAEAQKERGFREFARAVSSLESQHERSKPGSYAWFTLVQNYFGEQEKRFSLFRR